MVQSFTRRDDSGLKTAPAHAKEEEDVPAAHSRSPDPGQSDGADLSDHEVEAPSTVDLELTESTSTGEVPSPVTFRSVPDVVRCAQQ